MNNDIKKLEEAYDQMLNEGIKVAHIADIMSKINKSIGKIKGTRAMRDGMFTFLDYDDGQTYEIQIRPIEYGTYKYFHEEELQKSLENVPEQA